jgi:anthranilate phosphoribosyltransferase
MKHAVTPRKEIGIRTVFNVLGPLSNPAGARYQVLGVFRRDLTRLLAAVLGKLGCERALVVHGEDGMDEITTTGETTVCEMNRGHLETRVLHPADFGLPVSRAGDLRGGSARDNARLILYILQGETGPKRDIVLLNAGAALYLTGAAATIAEGIEQAARSIEAGKALEKLQRLVDFTRRATAEGGA